MRGETAIRGAPCSHPSPTRAVLGTSLNEATPTRRGKLEGIIGAEVWVKLVDADQPADSPIIASMGNPATFGFLTMTTRPTFRAEFKPGEGGNREF